MQRVLIISARKIREYGGKACTMIRYTSQKQPTLDGFETFFERELDYENRWVKLGGVIPWDELAEGYYRNLSSAGTGRPAKSARLVIGAVIIKVLRKVMFER